MLEHKGLCRLAGLHSCKSELGQSRFEMGQSMFEMRCTPELVASKVEQVVCMFEPVHCKPELGASKFEQVVRRFAVLVHKSELVVYRSELGQCNWLQVVESKLELKKEVLVIRK